MTEASNDTKTEMVTIKKYANRRLYNTATSSYVTLEDLAVMIKEGIDFVVFDAKTDEDITRSVLTHIIVEQENKGQNLLPVSFLRNVISFYGDSLETVVPKYLEHSMQSFTQNKDQMRDYMSDTFGGVTPFSAFEEAGKQNMAMFDQAMKMFTPFQANAASPTQEASAPNPTPAPAPQEENDGANDDLADLKDQLAAMQQQLNKMSKD